MKIKAGSRLAVAAGAVVMIMGLLAQAGPAQAKPAAKPATKPAVKPAAKPRIAPPARPWLKPRTPSLPCPSFGAGNQSVEFGGGPHNFSSSTSCTSANSLVHHWFDGSVWHQETLDGPGSPYPGATSDSVGRVNAVLVYGSQLHVWYPDDVTGRLRHAWFSSGAWFFEDLDGPSVPGGNGRTGDNVGFFPSVTQFGMQIQLFYADATSLSLRHAWFDGTTWNFEFLDGTNATAPGTTTDQVGNYAAAVVYGPQLHVWYRDDTQGSLRHAWWNGTGWSYEFQDGRGAPGADSGNGQTSDDVGQFTSAALYQGLPHVSYYDGNRVSLRHAWWNGSAWTYQTIDGPGAFRGGGRTHDASGITTSMMVFNGQLHVFTRSVALNSFVELSSLRHGWFDGTTWNFESIDGPDSFGCTGCTVDSVGGDSTSTFFAAFGQLNVFYTDFDAQALRHAWFSGHWAAETLAGSPPVHTSGRHFKRR